MKKNKQSYKKPTRENRTCGGAADEWGTEPLSQRGATKLPVKTFCMNRFCNTTCKIRAVTKYPKESDPKIIFCLLATLCLEIFFQFQIKNIIVIFTFQEKINVSPMLSSGQDLALSPPRPRFDSRQGNNTCDRRKKLWNSRY